jgi:hypothetical protein
MECEVARRELIQRDVVAKEGAMELERLNGVNGQAMGSSFCQEWVVPDGGADAQEATFRRQRSKKAEKEVLLFDLMNVADAVALPLLRYELVVEDSNAILKEMNWPGHGKLSRIRRRSDNRTGMERAHDKLSTSNPFR